MKRRDFIKTGAAAGAAMAVAPRAAMAQEMTLRLHQFLAPQAVVPTDILKPWGEAVTEATGGRVAVQHFDAMSLGGRPNELIDQARDGVVDLTMTLVGYTPGRFPRSEVFELPFMMTSPSATARAFWTMVEEDFQDSEFADLKILGAWNHGPGLIHSIDPIESLEDMRGKTVRGPTRVITDLLSELGAEPVGMPLPAIPEALSKGVVNATVIPWEVTPSIRLTELVENHTEFGGPEALYTATIILAMNKAKWESLDAETQEAIMSVSGGDFSANAAQIMLEGDAPGRQIAVDAGNNIITLDEAEVARWKEAAQPVYDRWIADMESQGIDGQALIDRARELIGQYS